MQEIHTELEIAASPEIVWSVLADFQDYPAWHPVIRAIHGNPKAGEVLDVHLRLESGLAMNLHPTIVVADPPRELRWSGRLRLGGMLDALQAFNIEALAGGRTRFRQSAEFRGLLTRLLQGRLREEILRGFKRTNEALKRRAEQAQRKTLAIPTTTPLHAHPEAAPRKPVKTSTARELAGSSWEAHDSFGSHFIYHFLPGGRLHYETVSGYWQDGQWQQQENKIELSLNRGQTLHHGILTLDGMTGTADNSRGLHWRWSATPDHDCLLEKNGMPFILPAEPTLPPRLAIVAYHPLGTCAP